jgi:hypothetical protein
MGDNDAVSAGEFPEAKLDAGWRRQSERIERGKAVSLAGRRMVV